jgi:Spy/CpxP family protein refolding chaperone
MNTRFLITAAVAAISISVFAQGKPPAGGPPGGPGQHRGGGMRMGMPEELKKQLNVTPAQEAKIKTIRDKYQAKFKAMGFDRTKMGQPGAPKPDFQKLRPLFEAQQKEIMAVYTPKQQAILKKYMDEHRRGPGGLGGPGGPGGKPGAGKGAGGKHGG